ncbi:hypothetical protein BFS14_14930 [Serratia fonticola]|uniref:hypothetical protein n=1 Tax=Serratia fonticola TaxID=47917 RepID=UPI0008FD66BD|nr:hypothetical protein [Serratia fonticola]MBC3252321.1 hypothetical protein [Serratia fonticola]OIX95650.1 hypothetical protein BFS14_14930 [Serratia fonticola]QCR62161.1 hypothetical protein FD644_18210 [Serratia fonticola]
MMLNDEMQTDRALEGAYGRMAQAWQWLCEQRTQVPGRADVWDIRWQLRRHAKRLMQWFGEYGFDAHPDKTPSGRTAKGFDWMDAWLTHEGVMDIAPRAKVNYREKVRRFYEQLMRLPKWKRKSPDPQVDARVLTYCKRRVMREKVMIDIVVGTLLLPCSAWATDIIVYGSQTVAGTPLQSADFPTNFNSTKTYSTTGGNQNITGISAGNTSSPWLIAQPGVTFGKLVVGTKLNGTDLYGIDNPSLGVGFILRGSMQVKCSTGATPAIITLDPTQPTLVSSSVNSSGGCGITSVGSQTGNLLGSYAPAAGVPTNGTGTATANLTLTAVATSNTIKGGVYGGGVSLWFYPAQATIPITLPNNIIVAQGACTLSPASVTGDLKEIALPTSATKTRLDNGQVNPIILNVSCDRPAETNTLYAGLTFDVTGTTTADTDGRVTRPNAVSTYLTLSTDNSKDCMSTDTSKWVKFGVKPSTALVTLPPSVTTGTGTATLYPSLCYTGIPGQPPGPNELTMTAKVFMY